MPVRIVSYNVRYFGHALRGLASTVRSKQRVARGLAGLDPAPDVMCLQEVETISLRSRVADRRANGDETQLESFMAELEYALHEAGRHVHYEAFYFRAHVNQLRGLPIYTTGLAVLVNTARLHVHQHNVESPEHITHHHVERWRDVKQTRICAHLTVGLGDRHVHVFNTHLSLPTPFASAFWKERDKMGFGVNQVAEAKTLVTFVKRHAGREPFVVCGDFNSPPGSPVWRTLTEEAGFESAQLTLGLADPAAPRGFPTAGFMRLRMHLDHLFSGNGVEWTDLEGTRAFGDKSAPFHGASDHVPLVGRFRLRAV